MVRRETKVKVGCMDLKVIVVKKETLGNKDPREMLVKKEIKVCMHLIALCVFVCMQCTLAY